ncbi:restriction endonuclease subunit S [Paraburkholderia sp.]|uniref:restriction endonuclease subunit S n=1 Tax=Paraburkholderia sp. TaxID=1926495 RepID=UPI0025F17787|nr:restriction endonuclease subunit S [Paraburkholderia sp.]
MSSKNKIATEKEEAKPVPVPKLRFPEFKSAGDWTTQMLGAVATIRTEKAGDNICVPMSITSGVGLVSQEEKFGRVIAGDSYKNYLLLKPNEFAYNKSSTKEYPEGFLTLYPGTELAAVPNSIFTCFRINGDSPDVRFLNYQFSGNLHGRWLRKFIQVGARAHGSLSINDNDLMALPVPVPTGKTSVAEQQKIAECLSSVDELIAAQARKVDALKTQKKGLIQQLFPREGETQPRLRFPEFRNAGEWEETRLGQLGVLVSGLTYSPDDVRESGLLVLRSSNVQQGEIALDDCVYVDASIKGANLSQPNDILICVRNGSKALIGKCALIPEGMPLCTHGAFMTVFRAQMPDFVFQLFQSDRYQRQVAGDLGATINSINGSQLLKYEFSIPKPEEQLRIASCLSSLDAWISAEAQKLEAFKTHKKGLMQQLFPSPGEVDA